MALSCRLLASSLLTLALIVTVSAPAQAQLTDTMCDPSFQDCRATLLNYVRRESSSIDLAMWFMEDQELADAIVARFRAGVDVRALVDPRRNTTTPMNATILAQFKSAGIPMRYKVGGGIMHWKYMIFNAQNVMQWSAANYGDYYFKPAVPYLDYTDEGIYFTNDPPVIDSFRRKFDDSWLDTTGFANYANIAGTLSRRYPLYTIDGAMSFVPAENFATRSKPLYDAETQRIDVIMYKITEPTHADGLIRAVQRGIPVRLITEPERYRNPENVWHAYHTDRLYMAGVQIRHRAHAGFTHQKSTLLYGQGMTVYGSSNWTSESNKSQYEHNYFTTKSWFFTWFKSNFDRKWGNTTGNAETTAFVPLPPDKPVYVAPANSAVNVSTSTATTISWKPGPWAHRADIRFGTTASPPVIASNVTVSPNSTKTFTLPALAAGTTYYWQVVSKTMAQQAAAGPVYSFTTAGGPPPPPPPPPPPGSADIVLYAADARNITGAWVLESDAAAAGGKRIRHPNAGAAKVAAAVAAPAHFFELTFNAEAGRPYRLWIRGKADSNSYANDSVFIQFSGAVTSGGAAAYRIGTTAGSDFNLEACGGCGLAGWGWEDNGWGTGVMGPQIYFAAGAQTLRVQTREDGLAIDQIVLSPGTYLNTSPGAPKNDTVILPRSGGTNPPPPPPPPAAGDVVLYAGGAAKVVGNWLIENDTTAAGGRHIRNPNAGAAKIATPSAGPASYFELTFTADAGKPYRLWIRGKAESNNYANDSVYVQFSNAVNQSGAAVFGIGTTSSTEYNLEACSGCGLAGWGWEDNGWGTGVLGPQIYFGATGPQTIRIQPREDGLTIDQIVLSPAAYLTTAPGAPKNDTTIVPR
jgi:hypothetical protein